MNSRKPVAEVAGAGLAGLTVAAFLAQEGWKVRVHEKGRELREIGAGIYLWENALNALRALGVYDKVAAAGVESKTPRALTDHNHNEIKLRRDGDPVPELVVCLRTDLHKILADNAIACGVEIVTNSKVVGADPEGRLELEHETTEKADLVVGADGVFSKVRDSLQLATSVVELKDGCGRHLIPRKKGDSVDHTRVEMWNGGRRVGIAPASKDHHYMFLCCPEYDTEGRIQQPFNLEAWVSSHPWYREYLERMPKNPAEHWRPFYNVTCSSWSKGNVCIIGDAAHGMAPNLGQGAGVAIVSSMVLAREVTRSPSVREGLERWQASELPYTLETQRMSYLYGAVGTKWPRALLGLRTRVLPFIARTTLVQRKLRCALDHVPGV